VSLERAAERALVGALLLEPGHLDDVRAWLRSDDFEGTAESQSFGMMLALREQDQALTPEAVDAGLRSSLPRGTQLADGAYLVTVMQETPEPGRASLYGRMVLELSIRRRVTEEAVRLRQRAEGASSTPELNLVFADVDTVRRGVEQLHQRETLAADSHSVTPLAGEPLRPLTRFPRYEEGLVEQGAIIALVGQPSSLGTVGRWLKPNDFGDDEAGALYAELLALHDARNPIDRLTLAWRAAKVGIEGPLSIALAEGRVETVDVDPVVSSRKVLEQSVRAAVIAVSEELETVALDAKVNTTSVAYERLNGLWPQQRRLVKARLSCAP